VFVLGRGVDSLLDAGLDVDELSALAGAPLGVSVVDSLEVPSVAGGVVPGA
jgi:hypothetical protein